MILNLAVSANCPRHYPNPVWYHSISVTLATSQPNLSSTCLPPAQPILSALTNQSSHNTAFIISQKSTIVPSYPTKPGCLCLVSSSLYNPSSKNNCCFLWCLPLAFRRATLLILFHKYLLSKYWCWNLCFLVLTLTLFSPLSTFFQINPYSLGKVHCFWQNDKEKEKWGENSPCPKGLTI